MWYLHVVFLTSTAIHTERGKASLDKIVGAETGRFVLTELTRKGLAITTCLGTITVFLFSSIRCNRLGAATPVETMLGVALCTGHFASWSKEPIFTDTMH